MLPPVSVAARRAGLIAGRRSAHLSLRHASASACRPAPVRREYVRWGSAAATLAALLVTVQSGGLLFTDSAQQPKLDLLDLETESNTSPETAQESLIKNKNARSGVGASMVPFEEAHLIPVNGEALTYVDPRPFRHMSASDLLSRFAVYTMCCIPKLIDVAPGLLNWGMTSSIPGVNMATIWLIQKTFFKQFVGAECADDCIPLMQSLSRDNLGALLNFSVEMIHSADGSVSDLDAMTREAKYRLRMRRGGKEAEAAQAEAANPPPTKHRFIYDSIIDDLMESVEVAGRFAHIPDSAGANSEEEIKELKARPSRNGSVMIAIKLSGALKDPNVLERASSVIVPREHFSAPPVPAPPFNVNGALGAAAGLAIPIAGLPATDQAALKELYQSLRRLAIKARDVGNVRLVMDAEYSWFQPAIDAMYEALANEFNRIPPAAQRGGNARDAWYKRMLPGAKEPEEVDHASPEYKDDVPGPLVFNTYQAYLRRTPSYLAASIERARAQGYTVGVKLVRGAYVESENKQWAKKDVLTPPASSEAEALVRTETNSGESEDEWRSPVWRNKTLTDRCFDGCAVRLIDEIASDIAVNDDHWPRISVIFATHNWQSSMKVARRMVDLGLASPPDTQRLKEVENQYEQPDPQASGTTGRPELVMLQLEPHIRGRIVFGQLLGMADGLTRRLQLAFDPYSGGAGPHMVLKYIPYGPLNLVMPYLVRRSIENKSVMSGSTDENGNKIKGAAQIERNLAGAELLRRLVPFSS